MNHRTMTRLRFFRDRAGSETPGRNSGCRFARVPGIGSAVAV